MIWHEASIWGEELRAAEFSRETDAFLIRPNGRKQAKETEHHAWFPTKTQAYQWRVTKHRRRFEEATRAMEHAEAEYNAAIELLEKHS